MRTLKLGAVAVLLVVAALALLWITEAIPRNDVADAAPKALGAVAVLVAAGVALRAIRGQVNTPDGTDKPVP